jgi:hypothetical protein
MLVQVLEKTFAASLIFLAAAAKLTHVNSPDFQFRGFTFLFT